MKTHKWSDLRKTRMTPKQIADSEAWARAKAVELDLKEMRKLVGKTQVETANAAHMAQSDISVLERREDYLMSTLRRYVTALGGELVVSARFGDKSIRLRSSER